MKIILASGSPRRRELLQKLNIDYEIKVSEVDESEEGSNPSEIVENLAIKKAKAVLDEDGTQDVLVIGADTLVFYENEVLGKPCDEDEARDMLSLLSNRTHQVYTGVALIRKVNGVETVSSFSEVTDVTFYEIDRFEIDEYIKTGSPLDKAGAYGIQDDFAKHIKKINGDYNNVVGLPVSRLYQEMKAKKYI